MKKIPNEQRVLDRMAPGVLCREGFLGSDPRELQEILDTDGKTVESLGLTHEQIAGRLEEIMHAAMAGMGRETPVGGKLHAVYRESMGRIPCPFAHGKVFPKGEIEVLEEPSGRVVRFTPLSVHLIREHGFYQGRGTRYRIEPDMLAEMLQLAPDEEPDDS